MQNREKYNWVDPEIINPDPFTQYKCVYYCTFVDPTIRHTAGYIRRGVHISSYIINTVVGPQRVVAYER